MLSQSLNVLNTAAFSGMHTSPYRMLKRRACGGTVYKRTDKRCKINRGQRTLFHKVLAEFRHKSQILDEIQNTRVLQSGVCFVTSTHYEPQVHKNKRGIVL